MTAADFVTNLEQLTPTYDDFKGMKVSDEFIKKEINHYKLISKGTGTLQINNEILTLINEFDVSNIEIGMVTLNNKIKEDNKYYFFGRFEVDNLVIEKDTGIIKLLEYEINHEMQVCAENSSKFLDALIVAAKHFRNCLFSDDLFDDQVEVCKVAKECADLAGGDKYLDFYKMYIGCDY